MTNRYERCRHCRRIRGKLRWRRLCWRCYDKPSIRVLYAATCSGYDGDGDINGGYRIAATPLRHPPGSEGRILELQARAALRVALFGHPLDNTVWRADEVA